MKNGYYMNMVVQMQPVYDKKQKETHYIMCLFLSLWLSILV